MNDRYSVLRFDRAVKFLPPGIRDSVRALSKEERAGCEEIRLRAGCCPTAVICGKEHMFSQKPVFKTDIESALNIATGASFHTMQNSIKNGFITVPGGYRIGIGGTAVIHNGEITGFRNISSLALRISREITGVSDEIVPAVLDKNGISSVLLVSPPGGGKTTLLRDLVRNVSNEGARVTVIDERSEIAALFSGEPQFDIGQHTDVLEGCPKNIGINMALRSLNPQLLAVDEITDEGDAAAILSAFSCGVKFIASAHAEERADLEKRPVYKTLMEKGVFDKIVYIKQQNGERTYTVEEV